MRGPRFRPRLVAAAVAGAVAFTSSSLRAEEDAQAVEEATKQFDAGIQALKDSDFASAIKAFKAAFEKKPHPLALYNEGVAWTGARPDAAYDCFAAALKIEGLPQDVHADAASRLAQGRARLVRIEVKSSRAGTVSMDGGCVVPAPAELYVAPGKHVLLAQLGDETVRREVEVKSGAISARVIDLDAPADATSSGQRPWLTKLRIIGFVAQGSSLLLGAAAIGIGVSGLSARDEFEAGGRVDVDLHDRAVSLRTAANVVWGLAGAALITGVVLMLPLDDGPSASRASAFFRASPDAGFIGVALSVP